MLVDDIIQDENTIRILLTTDNHVGYAETDPIRSSDSHLTFHEITQIANTHKVDMIIQGGDLFHISKPSKRSMFHVMQSLRLNCMGDWPVELEMLSDPSILGQFGVNYEDLNINVSIPVFAISGNHDDATGEDLLSAMDVLAMSGLINHFGKIPDSENITVSPLLFQKGTTKLSLYGMANVRDERLHRAFRDGIVKFLRPDIHTDEWFNFLAFHQNHAAHSFTSSIPESFLPKFLDFILWGHEHESIPYPVHNPEMEFEVLQAGSSVATSLSEGEIPDKHVFIMNVRGKDYSIEPIKLKTVRPFILKVLELSKTDLIPSVASKTDVIEYLTLEMEAAIEVANTKWKELNPERADSTPPLPLIRLKVEYSGGYEIENVKRFSNRFVGKIANINDAIQFFKKRQPREQQLANTKTKFNPIEENIMNKKSTELQLHDIIGDFLKQTQLTLIPEVGLNDAVKRFIENDDKTSLTQYIEKEVKRDTKMLLAVDIDQGQFHQSDDSKAKDVFKQLLKEIAPGKQVVLPEEEPNIIESDESDVEILSEEEEPKPKPRAKAKPRQTKATRGRTTRTRK
ncbi:DNA repair protein rad32 [Spathaspora sp. JA1]|nr:DNA repair protein rad32 [Spathaspora sp. JA1]